MATFLAEAFAGGVGATVLLVKLHQSRRKVLWEVRRQVVLRSELQHRVKNNHEILISLLEQQLNRTPLSPDAVYAFESMIARIYGLANIHQVLNNYDGEEVIKAGGYFEQLIAGFAQMNGTDAVFVETDIVDDLISERRLVALGIIVNELMTNTLKYARPPYEEELSIRITLRPAHGGYVFEYRDSGEHSADANPYRRLVDTSASEGGVGSYLVRSMARQLKAHLSPFRDNYYAGITLQFP